MKLRIRIVPSMDQPHAMRTLAQRTKEKIEQSPDREQYAHLLERLDAVLGKKQTEEQPA